MRQLVLFMLFIAPLNLWCQKNIEGTSLSHFQIESKKDTIDFIIADTNLTETKPILLFCQGSQPIPLIVDFGEKGIFPTTLNNFDLDEMNHTYHVVVISMPKTPLIVGPDHLNKSYNYVLDTARQRSYSVEYLKADYAENYIDRANKVIKYLMKKDWVNSKELVVLGHSQGARVAVGIASENKKVTKLGLFGYDPMGRIDQVIVQARKDAESGKISWEEADTIQQERIEFYHATQDKETLEKYPHLTAWQSFSKSTLANLLGLDLPIYVAYGSDDFIANNCDLLPLRFAEKKKSNLTIKRYPNLEHNFFPVDDEGTVDYADGRWKEVMKTFVDWAIE